MSAEEEDGRISCVNSNFEPTEAMFSSSDEPGNVILNTITEISKKSERWQQWNALASANALDDDAEPAVLGEGVPSFAYVKDKAKKPLASLPLFQTPSHLYVKYEQIIDQAMQEVRSLKSAIRDPEWEDHNADQIVDSLFALSKSCILAAQTFVSRQQYERGTWEFQEEENDDDTSQDIYQQELPTLEHTINQFIEAKYIQEDLRSDAKAKQREIKFRSSIYSTPTFHSFFEREDNLAMKHLDLKFTNYSSIEDFLFSVLREPSHPFGKALIDFIEYFDSTITPTAAENASDKKILKKISLRVSQFVESLTEGVIRRYQYLELYRWESEVLGTIHNEVMNRLYRSILPFYMIHHTTTDELLDTKIRSLQQYKENPLLLGVQKRLCVVLSQKKEDLESEHHEDFDAALHYLRELPVLTNIPDKLHNLVQTINILCTSVEAFYFRHIKTPVTLSADDVLSLFVYAIISANIPCIFSQCRLIDDFLLDSASLGEEGYALATLDTALNAILHIDYTIDGC